MNGTHTHTININTKIKIFCPNCGTIKLTTKHDVESGGIRWSDNEGRQGRSPTIGCDKCNRIFRRSDLIYDFKYDDNWG